MNYYFYVIASKNRRHEAGNCVSRKRSIDQGKGRGGRAGGEVGGGAMRQRRGQSPFGRAVRADGVRSPRVQGQGCAHSASNTCPKVNIVLVPPVTPSMP